MAGKRAPGELLRDVQRMAAAGWPPGLVVLSGDSAFHLDAAQRAILDSIVPADAGPYALTVYGDEKVSVGTVVAACRSVGMFAERRVVLVRDLEMLDGEPDALLDYAAKPAPNSHLILRAPKLDRRRKLGKALAKQKMFLLFEVPHDPRSAAREIGPLALEQGLKLDREATALLTQVCGGDLYHVVSELAKLASWLGGAKRTVGVDDVRETVAGEGAMSGWALSDAIRTRDRTQALNAARKLVEAGEAPLRIVGGIAWQARKMLADRETRHYEIDELLAFPAHLLAADRALKSRQIAPGAVLESLVDRLIGTN